jgi:hypothetical protein
VQTVWASGVFAGDDLDLLMDRTARQSGFKIQEHWLQPMGCVPSASEDQVAWKIGQVFFFKHKITYIRLLLKLLAAGLLLACGPSVANPEGVKPLLRLP